MDKFEKWLKDRGYLNNLAHIGIANMHLPYQTYIGFMIEYLSEHGRILNKSLDESIEDYFKRLKSLIEEI